MRTQHSIVTSQVITPLASLHPCTPGIGLQEPPSLATGVGSYSWGAGVDFELVSSSDEAWWFLSSALEVPREVELQAVALLTLNIGQTL